jgi:hypothetical protein
MTVRLFDSCFSQFQLRHRAFFVSSNTDTAFVTAKKLEEFVFGQYNLYIMTLNFDEEIDI